MDDQVLRISLVQPSLAWEDRETNLKEFSRICHSLAGKTDLVVLPEMFTTGFTMEPEKMAETPDGRTTAWMQETARETGAALTGSIVVREKDRFMNRLLFVKPDGSNAYYDKRHLFRMGEEQLHYSAGNRRLLVEWKGWRICPLICYDLRFPVWSRNRQDYDLLIYVANWPAPRREVWKALLLARALENQCVVAGVNRVGSDGRGLDYSGDSMVYDARGRLLSHLEPNLAGVETIALSLEELKRFREKFPVHLDADDFTLNL